ncbi:helix-turn-helix transcriptional regulator [Aliivibrio sp. S4TY2]|uniref:helix-turn-helix domain-containing protein n=1 Tax=unclassified Aliivibrio TaxID=2645654 RepID=UPI002378CEB1|nr:MULTISPECIES: helix-turn-helix transcriptional regulator [unclassified Aliivibrio]MDD9158254.1 helix-turn-helix transcriptional regulator [Aliivibrio sp. S4TY2]MDD9162169.1 helix-turn-helix transcriptional regulator [Aliivibrio sp. S4TY1]MDD9166207.1 helix-turn-helix transcriptional regulator [Aliivibrio sp. S4MY2]MDD9170205.1 helix-turn-helix transcriptional regulator [Aliivibrio sp. S4MY4]MDD9187256.1 helix-turn-helix transcriptional regulator [Aliivibrio sp. S4MY3]
MSFEKKLKAIIKEEGYSQAGFASEIGISTSAVEKYISGKQEPAGGVMLRIVNHEKFKKYTLWLMTGDVNPDAGQICPAFSTQEKCGLTIGNGDIQKKA